MLVKVPPPSEDNTTKNTPSQSDNSCVPAKKINTSYSRVASIDDIIPKTLSKEQAASIKKASELA